MINVPSAADDAFKLKKNAAKAKKMLFLIEAIDEVTSKDKYCIGYDAMNG